MPPYEVHEESILFITLDSCRFDTFEAAACPNLKAIGPTHLATAPATFTYASHQAMFVGFTPGTPEALPPAERDRPWLNPKRAKFFKLAGTHARLKGGEFMALEGATIIEGLANKGYLTLGTGAADWFNDQTPAGRRLVQDFDKYLFAGNTWSLGKQLDWAGGHLRKRGPRKKVFLFINVGETHVPYYHEGAAWDRGRNPCRPFAADNDAAECRRRQRACLEWVDARLADLLAGFRHASTLVCGDHGDCWGEDGLWEHGVHHPKVLEVPLLFRMRGGKITPEGAQPQAR